MNKKNFQQGMAIGQVVLGATIFGLIALFFYGISNQSTNNNGTSEIWNENMNMGSIDAPNVFIEYTDYFCSYCSDLHEVTDEQFIKDYIETGLVRFENRITTLLGDVSENSKQGAEAAYCAADQNKYWEYSGDIISRIKTDYFDKGIGVKDVASPQRIGELPINYFLTSAENVEIDVDTFQSCLENNEHYEEIEKNTNHAISLGVNGLPYVVINDYTSSGFSGDYNTLKTLLKAGGVSID